MTFNCGRQLLEPRLFSPHIFSALPADPPPSLSAHQSAEQHYLAHILYDSVYKHRRQPSLAPTILVLALQEVAPIAYSFLGGSFLREYFARFIKAVNTAATSTFSTSNTSGGIGEEGSEGLESNSRVRYELLRVENVGMTAILIFVRQEMVGKVKDVRVGGVGCGWWSMGNKGAVGVRMALQIDDGGEAQSGMDMTILSAHLAPMEDAVQRRNQDWRTIVEGMGFEAGKDTKRRRRGTANAEGDGEETEPLLNKEQTEHISGIYSQTSHLILAGDLNYRTSAIGPLTNEYRSFPQPSEDDSFPQHFEHLLGSDQLRQELSAGRTLQGLSEAPIEFPPTYKYSDRARRDAVNDRGDMDASGKWWDWARHRWPSWCDRVLYLDLPSWITKKDPSAKIKVQGYKALPLMPNSDHRPVACSILIPLEPISKPDAAALKGGGRKQDSVRMNPPFELNPAWKSDRTSARIREIVVGLAAYLTLTWEGNGILLALICGALGGWALISSITES